VRLLVATAAALALLAGAAAAAPPDWASLGLTAYAPPKPAPEFALPDLAGKTRTLAEFRGKALLLFFWATW
jgi:protein SCO1/2